MIKHITFATDNMSKSATKCIDSAVAFGCDNTSYFKPCNIYKDFVKENKAILDQPRGAGFWLWKPYFILKALEASEPGDVIVYTDAGVEFVNNVEQLIKAKGDEPVMIFGNGWRHGDWCKADVVKAMSAELYVNHDQAQASCLIFDVCLYSKAFVSEWLEWCCKPGMIDDSPSKEPNEPTFREHRHDQAILTNLAIRENLTFHRWPAQYNLRGNEKYKDEYPQIFLHLGLRNNGKRQ